MIGSSLGSGEFGKFQSDLFQALVNGIRKHAPVALRDAFDAAIAAVADAVEARRIDYRQ
jgi:hypothetical protein